MIAVIYNLKFQLKVDDTLQKRTIFALSVDRLVDSSYNGNLQPALNDKRMNV